jgi:hypothetical protein
LIATGPSMLAITLSAPPQCSQVKMSILTKSPGAIWNRRRRARRAEGRMPGVIPASNVGPRQRDVGCGRGLVGGLSTTPAAPRRRHLVT